MQEYYKVLKDSDTDSVKADMQLLLNICARNEINSEESAKRIYTVLNESESVFKSGVGKMFILELRDRIVDYRYIDNLKNNKDMTDLTVVRSIIKDIEAGNDVLKSRVGQSFLQQLISLERELEVIDIIKTYYDLKDKETVTNLLLVLTEPGNEFFQTKVGKEFVAGLEKKVGEVYLSKKSDKPVLLFAIAVIFLVAGISFGVAGKYIADDAYKQKMAEQLVYETNVRPKKTAAPLQDISGNGSKQDKLASENADMAGWIRVEGTDIDYPVMHRGDNSFYLEHNFYGDYDRNGSLFIDRYCSIFPQSENIIIYGHNVNGAPSFGQIKFYKDKGFYELHPNIYFDTIYEKGTYQVVAAFITSVEKKGFKYYLFYGYDNEEQFNEFAEYVKKKATYDTGVSMEFGDKFITLSTCDYAVSDGRFVVVAKKIK